MVMPRRPKVALTPENHFRLLELLDYSPETGLFIWRKTRGGSAHKGTIAGAIDGNGYINIRVLRKTYKAHRLAWFYMHGQWPKIDIDHRDGNKTNNAIENLREATDAQNVANSNVRRDNTTGYRGVRKLKYCNKWGARITENGKRRSLGNFTSPEEAYAAYCDAARKHFGQFARV